MYTRRCLIPFVGLLFFACTAVLHAEQTLSPAGDLVSFYSVARSPEAISVDGSLDEFAWQMAAQINGFERILNYYDSIAHPTRAKMLWDDEYFYFGFACHDPDIWAIFDKEDDPMWSEEVVEVFIDPDGDGKNYLELEVNPLNAVVDLKIVTLTPVWESSQEWDIAGLRTAVRVRGTVNDSARTDLGWTVEIAIPWSAMAGQIDGGERPDPGDTWRLNLYRIERKAGRNLKKRIDALQAKADPMRAQIQKLLEDSGVEEEEDLKGKQRREWEKIQKKLAPIEAELEPLNQRYDEQTEYTAWSETFQRGFHHPPRFGVVRFTR